MKIIKNIISSVNFPKVIGAFKKSDTKTKISEISKMGGSGLLILEGINLTVTGANNESHYTMIAGVVMLIGGVYLAERLGKQITEINEDDQNRS